MQCKFLEHGVAIGYDHVVKPCCEWIQDSHWNQQNHINIIDLATWHQSPQMQEVRTQLESGTWPAGCQRCQVQEQQGRQDSLRLNGDQSYADYHGQDITLEIRPGSVCNFACQTCWPAASSRVAQFHHQAGIIDIKSVDSAKIDNFDFLLPVASQIRNVVLLGGEPFYDPSCQKFLAWAQQNLCADIVMFTNASKVDWSWVHSYPGRIVMVFSIDAVGQAAEYVRYGTNWSEVMANFKQAQQHPKVELRVNITMSVYNYHLLDTVIDLLVPAWPKVVSFGWPRQRHFTEVAVPVHSRAPIIAKLQKAIDQLVSANIEVNQKQTAINALASVISSLQQNNFDSAEFDRLRSFVAKMDQVKHISIKDSATPLDFS